MLLILLLLLLLLLQHLLLLFLLLHVLYDGIWLQNLLRGVVNLLCVLNGGLLLLNRQ